MVKEVVIPDVEGLYVNRNERRWVYRSPVLPILLLFIFPLCYSSYGLFGIENIRLMKILCVSLVFLCSSLPGLQDPFSGNDVSSISDSGRDFSSRGEHGIQTLELSRV